MLVLRKESAGNYTLLDRFVEDGYLVENPLIWVHKINNYRWKIIISGTPYFVQSFAECKQIMHNLYEFPRK